MFVVQLVEVNTKPRIKLSEDVEKVTIPGMKIAYRLYGTDGEPAGWLWASVVL